MNEPSGARVGKTAGASDAAARGSSLPPLFQQSLDAMNGQTLRRKVIVKNPQGLHLRHVRIFAERAGQFPCSVTVAKKSERVNGKSIMELLLLAAEQGTELELEVSGPDAQRAIDELAEVLAAPGLEEADNSSLSPKG
jgi:phosphotransferase system HPr (HPr) family protein